MGEFVFGSGNGRISAKEIGRRRKIAEKHGAQFLVTTGNSGHCVCGHGCRRGECPTKHYWFAVTNRGEPFNSEVAKAVMALVDGS